MLFRKITKYNGKLSMLCEHFLCVLEGMIDHYHFFINRFSKKLVSPIVLILYLNLSCFY